MPRLLTNGQRAAVRAAKARRGELRLTQKDLAQAAGVTVRTVEMFETYRTWPRTDTLAQLERLGLGWPVGYLTEYAIRHDEPAQSTIDADIAEIMQSNLHPDLKLRLIDHLRSVSVQKIRDELPDIEQRIAGTVDPGEGPTEGREIA